MTFVPAAIMAAATIASAAGQGAASNAARRRMAKEEKKLTQQDVLMDLLKQRLESSQSTRKSQASNSINRARAMQKRAAAFRNAVAGG